MMLFEISYSQNGALHKTEMQAKNRAEVVAAFKKKADIRIIKIQQIQQPKQPIFIRPLNPKILALVFYQFAILLNAAVPLQQILDNFSKHPHSKIRVIFKQALLSVQQGKQLCDGFGHFSKDLGIGIPLIELGEKSGNLTNVLLLFVEHLRLKAENRSRIFSALMYPSFLVVAMIAALFVIVGFLLPQFESLFISFNKTLPPITYFLFSLQILVTPAFIGIYIIAILCIIAFFMIKRRNKNLQLAFDTILLKLPIVGRLLETQYLFFYFSTMKLLISAGFVLETTLELCAKTCSNLALQKQLLGIISYLKQGHSLTQSMRHATILEPIVLDLIAAAELSGEMDKMLKTIAEVYELETKEKEARLLSLIEPIITCIMAGIVLVIALGVFLPLWELNSFAAF